MESRIILSMADFSQNNIGRYVVLSELTKKVLAKQTQYSDDSNEAIALDLFLNSLVSDGLLGGDNPKIKNLYIPALASTHDELFYDIAQLDANGYPTDGMSSAEKSATHKAFTPYIVDNKVLGVLASSSLDNPDLLTGSEYVAQSAIKQNIFNGLVTYPTFSCVYYNLQDYSNYSTRYQLLSNKADTSSTEGQVGFEIATTRINMGKDNANRCYITNSDNDTPIYSTGFIGFSYQPTGIRMKVLANSGDITHPFSATGDYSNIITTEAMQNTINVGTASYSTSSKASVIIFSDLLTDEELVNIRTLTQSLMVGLGVTNN